MLLRQTWIIAVLSASAAIPSMTYSQEPHERRDTLRPFPDTLPAGEIAWVSGFGERKNEPHVMYLLLTRGGFRAPRSAQFDSLVIRWLADHPRAVAVVVHVQQPLMTDQPQSQARAVWIVQDTSHLNLALVRAGAVPGGTMQMPPFGRQVIDSDTYERFLLRLRNAEAQAQQERLGIWKLP